jgi:hypothetical protein
MASCPHCSVENPDGAAFCGSCGKALPDASAGGPRVVTAADYATTGAGKQLQIGELDRQRRKAFGILLAVAILQAIGGVIILAAGRAVGVGTENVVVNPLVYGIVFGLAFVFLVLSLWARKSPLPASIVGLVVFCTVHLLDAVANPLTLLNGILVKIIIVVLLIQAIMAGVRHREALRQQSMP